VVVVITGLLLVGKRASKPKDTGDPAKQNVSGSATPSGADPAIGSVAPDFSLKSVPDGKTVSLSSLRGKAVVVNFWATWCGPCKIEMPWLVDLQKKYGDQGLQIVGITKDDSNEATIAKFTQKNGRELYDSGGQSAGRGSLWRRWRPADKFFCESLRQSCA